MRHYDPSPSYFQWIEKLRALPLEEQAAIMREYYTSLYGAYPTRITAVAQTRTFEEANVLDEYDDRELAHWLQKRLTAV